MHHISALHALHQQIQHDATLTEEDIVLLTHYAGTLHSDLLERVEGGLSERRKKTYYKQPKTSAQCACGGKQKPAYTVNDEKVCQRCYKKSKG